jgi:hypothetical protein
MSPTLSATNRNASFTGLPHSSDRASLLPTTPTLRLLEITGCLSRDRSERLPSTRSDDQPQSAFPDRPSALTASQAFGVVTCCFLLSAIVAALIISLG